MAGKVSADAPTITFKHSDPDHRALHRNYCHPPDMKRFTALFTSAQPSREKPSGLP